MSNKKAIAYPIEQVIAAIQSIASKELRIYGAITLYLATRSGEIMPYRHYSYTYEKNSEGKTMKTIAKDGQTKYPSKRTIIKQYDSPGIEVTSIRVFENRIEFNLPVFKCKQPTQDIGFIFKKNNPFYEEIKEYILSKQLQRRILNKPVYLFQANGNVEKYFYNFKKRFIRALQKQIPGAKVHSLRKTMATHAANISGGNIFFVKGVTRHRKLETLNEYVAPVQLKNQFEKYLEVDKE